MHRVVIGGQKIPSECPKKCPGDEMDLCFQCPVFNCRMEPIISDPKDFRKDWAVEWEKWFDDGMIGKINLDMKQFNCSQRRAKNRRK